MEADIPTTENNPTKTAWRRREFRDEFPCGETYLRKLEEDGVVETIQVGPKMTLIVTSPSEARERAAQRYAATGKAAEVKRRLAKIRPKTGTRRDKTAEQQASKAA